VSSPTVAAPPARWVLDSRFHAPLLITIILLSAHLTQGILESPGQTLLAIGTAVVVELIAGKMVLGTWPHLASAYITGISVGVILRTPLYWPFALCAAISILSKYAIRLDGRHIWNPSNFGVSFMLFVYPWSVAHLSVQWGNAWWSLVMVWSLGSIVIWRLRRFHICATYVIAFLVLAVARAPITGHSLITEIAPITGPMYQLFIIYMITDPRTTVRSKTGQAAMVLVVAIVECVFRCLPTFVPGSPLVQDLGIHAPFYALFLVGPQFLVAEILRDRRARLDGAPPPP
jgi:enediyne biosynthesis protein E5